MSEVSWHRDMLPDFLWLALMLGRRSDWAAAYSALDVLDAFVPDGPRVLDGRLTSFALVPEERRPEALRALVRDAPHAVPRAFGHAIGLYSTCPARWLYAEWLEANEPDPGVGVPLLQSLIQEHADKYGTRETRLRMAAMSRHLLHRKITFGGELAQAGRYPGGLTPTEQAGVESSMRAAWGSIHGMQIERHPDVAEWPVEFWRRGRELVDCSIPERQASEVTDVDEDGPLHPEPTMLVSEMQAVLTELDELGGQLRTRQLGVQREPSEDERTAVLFGFASRMYRLLFAFVERPSAWAADTAPFHLRPIVDARILSAWLVKRNDPAVFAAYREHGLGRLKLLRAHIREDLGDDLDEDLQAMMDHLDKRVNLERDEWAQPVNLGSFADVSPRQMAIEADLKREYDLAYAPFSSENHGEWPTVRESDTVLCKEPLHLGHRVGAFSAPSRTLAPPPVEVAFRHVREGIVAIYDHFDLDVQADFEPLREALDTALYESGDLDDEAS